MSSRLIYNSTVQVRGQSTSNLKNSSNNGVVMRPLQVSRESKGPITLTPSSTNGGSPSIQSPQVIQTSDYIEVVREDKKGNNLQNGNVQNQVPKNLSLNGSSTAIQKATRALDGKELILDTDFKWAQESYSPLVRSIDIWKFILQLRAQLFLLDQKWTYVGGFSEEKKIERARQLAIFVRESILQLGPTFIKLGQLFSTRSDLFPQEFVDELAKLQDKVPAFAPEKAKEMIERELGQPIDSLFKRFEEYPIAAASLGQVHRGQLHTGELVAIKIQRPGLSKLFEIDLNNMRILAEFWDAQNEDANFYDVYEECSSILWKEIDYINEGRNADRFRRNFRNISWVRTPKVYWAYSSPKILTLEYLSGEKISETELFDRQGLDKRLLAQRATEAYIMQITQHGFFHADPHPGNVSVDEQGNLLYYDFGMMGEIKPDLRKNMLEVCYGVYSKDATRIIDSLIRMGVVKEKGDKLSLRRTLIYFMDNIARQTEMNETLDKIGEDLFSIGSENTVKFPATFTFVFRSLSTLEGVGKLLDSDYKFSKVAQPYAMELLQQQQQQSFAIQAIQQQAGQIGQATASVPMRVERMERILSNLEIGELKVRAKVLESERFDYRASVIQAGTLQAIASMGLLNLGATFLLMDKIVQGEVVLGAAAVFAVLFLLSMRRVKNLVDFESKIR